VDSLNCAAAECWGPGGVAVVGGSLRLAGAGAVVAKGGEIAQGGGADLGVGVKVVP